MLLREALEKGTEILKHADVEAPVMEAGALLCSVLKCDRTFLYTHGEEELGGETAGRFLRLAALRAQGKPLQYITGHQEFMSLDFRVDPHVLIPRQDTETLVEAVLRHAVTLGQGRELHLLDIGTGSGCIAISLAHYLENLRVTAVDISAGALKVAAENAVLNKVEEKITFVQGDIFDLWKRGRENRVYDVIVSNPPYIRSEEIARLQREVRDHEPVSALDGGKDGLTFYRFLAQMSPRHLKPGGYLAFEVGYDQAGTVGELMKENFERIEIIKDLSGVGRAVAGKFKEGV